MNTSNPFYLSLVHHGYVLTYQESGKPSGVVMSHPDERGDEDKWTIEQGDEPDIVAIKSVASGRYLTATPKDESPAGAGDDRQWWKIEPCGNDIHPPGSYRLSMVGYPDLFLGAYNTSEFKRGKPGWRIYVRKWPVINEYYVMCWRNPELHQALGDREAALAKKYEDNAEAEKASQRREAALAQQVEDNATARKALEAREVELAKKEEDSASRKNALEEREAAVSEKEKIISASKIALKKSEAAFAQKEKEQATGWDKKTKEMQALQQSSTQQKKPISSNVGPPGCGYKHHKPPRKLNRKVIGLVYEP